MGNLYSALQSSRRRQISSEDTINSYIFEYSIGIVKIVNKKKILNLVAHAYVYSCLHGLRRLIELHDSPQTNAQLFLGLQLKNSPQVANTTSYDATVSTKGLRATRMIMGLDANDKYGISGPFSGCSLIIAVTEQGLCVYHDSQEKYNARNKCSQIAQEDKAKAIYRIDCESTYRDVKFHEMLDGNNIIAKIDNIPLFGHSYLDPSVRIDNIKTLRDYEIKSIPNILYTYMFLRQVSENNVVIRWDLAICPALGYYGSCYGKASCCEETYIDCSKITRIKINR